MPDLLPFIIPIAAVVVSYAVGFFRGRNRGIHMGFVYAVTKIDVIVTSVLLRAKVIDDQGKPLEGAIK